MEQNPILAKYKQPLKEAKTLIQEQRERLLKKKEKRSREQIGKVLPYYAGERDYERNLKSIAVDGGNTN